ncbi:uracil-DNA glycosylase [Paenibacillus sp.]|uniref:uracil-DNA glycosylase n=1 Tax=Paenibacillus sp. TaxID=58172 RepID=UPI002D59257A|nr:uracil-DNA glycosylase [Paenibacillus sp.]HZG84955.1 uracil-DNA glycosylase [Paenibacillus sp.]
MDTEWRPAVWPEIAPPADAAACERCELSRQRARVIWAEGGEEAPIAAVLDNPGAREDREGTPFVCATRSALQRAVAEAGLTAEELFVTYLLKCRPIRAYDKEAARKACFAYLEGQLEGRRAIMLLGLVAARFALDRPDAEMAELRGRWHEFRGIPARVTYHPLAVHRRPNLAKGFFADWRELAVMALPAVGGGRREQRDRGGE